MAELATSSMVLGNSADDAATIQKTVFSLLDTIRQAEVKRVLTNTAKAHPADDFGNAEDTDDGAARASFETVNDVMCGQALTMLRQNIWKNHVVPSDCGFTSDHFLAQPLYGFVLGLPEEAKARAGGIFEMTPFDVHDPASEHKPRDADAKQVSMTYADLIGRTIPGGPQEYTEWELVDETTPPAPGVTRRGIWRLASLAPTFTGQLEGVPHCVMGFLSPCGSTAFDGDGERALYGLDPSVFRFSQWSDLHDEHRSEDSGDEEGGETKEPHRTNDQFQALPNLKLYIRTRDLGGWLSPPGPRMGDDTVSTGTSVVGGDVEAATVQESLRMPSLAAEKA